MISLSSRAGALTVCYAVTPDAPYARCAAASLYSAARSAPGIRVRVAEVNGGDYPWGVLPAALPGPEDEETEWVLVLDADTWVNGDLTELLDGAREINLRVSRAWRGKKLDKKAWYAILDQWHLSHVPVYSNGVILCHWDVAVGLRDALPAWMDVIVDCGLPDPLHMPGRPEWWMRDQFALSAAVVARHWDVGLFGNQKTSWDFAHEKPGLIHHIGKDVDPFGEKEWPRHRKV